MLVAEQVGVREFDDDQSALVRHRSTAAVSGAPPGRGFGLQPSFSRTRRRNRASRAARPRLRGTGGPHHSAPPRLQAIAAAVRGVAVFLLAPSVRKR